MLPEQPGIVARTVARLNSASAPHTALLFLIAATVLQLPVLLIPGYFSHDELQWLSFAQRPWNELFGLVSFADVRPFQYRPLTFNLWLIISKLFGDSPLLMHLVRGGLGIATGGLLALLKSRLGATKLQAMVGALLFLMTPIAVYTNGWVGTYADTLCLLLFLAIALWLTRSVQSTSLVTAPLVFTATTLALLSKESAIVFPALLFLAWLIRRQRAVLVATVASGIAVAVYIAFRADVILFPAVRLDIYTWKLSNIPARMIEYALFPFSLNRFESIFQPDRPLAWVAAALCLVVVGVVARLGWRWAGALLLGFYAALGPVLILSFSANHYAYLAVAYASVVLTLAWPRIGRGSRALLTICLLVVTIHGTQMMRIMYRVGNVQAVMFSELVQILPTVTDKIAVRAANEKDNFIVDRLLHDIPSYQNIKFGDRVVAAPASARLGEITHRMQRDGRLTRASE